MHKGMVYMYVCMHAHVCMNVCVRFSESVAKNAYGGPVEESLSETDAPDVTSSKATKISPADPKHRIQDSLCIAMIKKANLNCKETKR